jgi:hypothetical protein
MPEARLADVHAFLQTVQESEAAWATWNADYGSPHMDEVIRAAVEDAMTDPRPSIPHENVAAWLRSWGSKQELPPPAS